MVIKVKPGLELERTVFINKKTNQMSIVFPKNWFGHVRPEKITLKVLRANYE